MVLRRWAMVRTVHSLNLSRMVFWISSSVLQRHGTYIKYRDAFFDYFDILFYHFFSQHAFFQHTIYTMTFYPFFDILYYDFCITFSTYYPMTFCSSKYGILRKHQTWNQELFFLIWTSHTAIVLFFCIQAEVDAGAILVQEAVPCWAATQRRVCGTESERQSTEPSPPL